MQRIVIATVLLIGIGCDLSQPPQPAATPSPATPKIADEPIPGVSVAELREAYKTNEVSADKKYKGKTVVIIEAKIKSISKDFLDKPYLVLSSGDQFADIQAYFDPRFEAQLMDLKAGQVANVGGRVDGLLMGSLILREAQIVKAR